MFAVQFASNTCKALKVPAKSTLLAVDRAEKYFQSWMSFVPYCHCLTLRLRWLFNLTGFCLSPNSACSGEGSKRMRTLVNRFVRDDQGQDLIEYAILIGLITVGVVGIVASIGSWVSQRFTALNNDLYTNGVSGS